MPKGVSTRQSGLHNMSVHRRPSVTVRGLVICLRDFGPINCSHAHRELPQYSLQAMNSTPWTITNALYACRFNQLANEVDSFFEKWRPDSTAARKKRKLAIERSTDVRRRFAWYTYREFLLRQFEGRRQIHCLQHRWDFGGVISYSLPCASQRRRASFNTSITRAGSPNIHTRLRYNWAKDNVDWPRRSVSSGNAFATKTAGVWPLNHQAVPLDVHQTFGREKNLTRANLGAIQT